MNMILIILLMLVSTMIGAFGSIFLKKGAERFHVKISISGVIELLKNWRVILGLTLYALSTVGFIYLLRTEELSMLYPMTSMGYVFVTMFSVFLLKERLNIYKILGITFIVLGFFLVTI